MSLHAGQARLTAFKVPETLAIACALLAIAGSPAAANASAAAITGAAAHASSTALGNDAPRGAAAGFTQAVPSVAAGHLQAKPKVLASPLQAKPKVLASPLQTKPKVRKQLLGGILRFLSGIPLPLNPISIGAGFVAGELWKAIDSWVLDGAGAALSATAGEISTTTAPQLQSTWFSANYWRVAGLAALLTLPFLCAAAVQALMRSDLGLLVRAAFGYLPLAMVGVSLAAPLTMLLLSATDQLCAAVSPSGAGGAAHFLASAATDSVGVSAIAGSGFLAFIVGLFTVAAAIALLLEMLIREAAVYIVVLMLPLAFAAAVWPARRILASRMLELLVSLILSKFAIVAALSLGGAAYGNGTDDPSRLLAAMALVILSTFAPWAMLRLIPFTEIAAGASSAIHGELPRLQRDGRTLGGARCRRI